MAPRPVTVAPGIRLLGGLEPGAAYVVETSSGLVLIDAGLDKDAALIKSQLQMLGLDWRRIHAILLTHVHGDHSGGAQSLRAATGAKVYAGSGDAETLRAGGPREAFFSTFAMPESLAPEPTTVDVELSGEQIITVDDLRFRAMASPGHTPGSVCYLMERGGGVSGSGAGASAGAGVSTPWRVLFSGDVIWSLRPLPVPAQSAHSIYARPLGTYATYLSPRYRGDATSYLATLRRLRALPAPDLVLPGHPRNDEPPASPQMTQPLWEALIDPGIREMALLVSRYRQDGAPFLDGAAKKLLSDLYYLGDFHQVAVYGFFAAGKFFLVNAPGGPRGSTGKGGPPEQRLSDFVTTQLAAVGVKGAAPATILLTSGKQEESGGVAELVARYHATVVASRAAWAAIGRTCPPRTHIVFAEEANHAPDPAYLAIPLSAQGDGPGKDAVGSSGPVAYQVMNQASGKTVLFTGRVPIKLPHGAAAGVLAQVLREHDDPASAPALGAALEQFGRLRPDLWLPAFPVEGQNANLYGDEWVATVRGRGGPR